MNAMDQLVTFYNSNDFSELKNILAENCIYRSQWVFDEICGKDQICEYLTAKSKVIAKSGCFPRARKVAISRPCQQEAIAISQGSAEVRVIMLLDIENGKIRAIDLCMPKLFEYTALQ